MRAIEIDNIKAFTTQLFAKETFDDFLAVECVFQTAASFTIDGHLNESFIGEEQMLEPDNKEGIISWRKLRPICYEIIKGKKVPQQFKIVFKLSNIQTESYIRKTKVAVDPAQIRGLFLNIVFKGGKIVCTTGTALKIFTMDKSLEIQWDDTMEHFLKKEHLF